MKCCGKILSKLASMTSFVAISWALSLYLNPNASMEERLVFLCALFLGMEISQCSAKYCCQSSILFGSFTLAALGYVTRFFVLDQTLLYIATHVAIATGAYVFTYTVISMIGKKCNSSKCDIK
jgi:hypothetical protein